MHYVNKACERSEAFRCGVAEASVLLRCYVVYSGCCLPTAQNNQSVLLGVTQSKMNTGQQITSLFYRWWCGWLLVLEDGRWPVRLVDREVATGRWRERNNSQGACNETVGRFRVNMLLWESSKYWIVWVCVCSSRYPACNAHAPCGLPRSTIFLHIIS